MILIYPDFNLPYFVNQFGNPKQVSLCFKISNYQVLRKEKKDAMARWVVANDVTLEQVTRCSCLFNRIMCSLSPAQYFCLPIFEFS